MEDEDADPGDQMCFDTCGAKKEGVFLSLCGNDGSIRDDEVAMMKKEKRDRWTQQIMIYIKV